MRFDSSDGRSMKYGLNYQGSKNQVAAEICALFPTKTNFYDLFMGGGAITHRLLHEGRFDKLFINDINPLPMRLFYDSARGQVPKPRWVSHEEFAKNRKDDAYTACLFCFGGDWESYAYGKEVEPIKEALHYAVVDLDFSKTDALGIDLRALARYPTWQARRAHLKAVVKMEARKDKEHLERLVHLERVAQLEHLERLVHLERVAQLEHLERLVHLERVAQLIPCYNPYQVRGLRYDEVTILPDSVIYCDPPYKDTKKYQKESFDHDAFYDWCRKQTEITFISEYTMPDDFICIHEFYRLEGKAAYQTRKVTERLFIPGHQRDMYDMTKTTLF